MHHDQRRREEDESPDGRRTSPQPVGRHRNDDDRDAGEDDTQHAAGEVELRHLLGVLHVIDDVVLELVVPEGLGVFDRESEGIDVGPADDVPFGVEVELPGPHAREDFEEHVFIGVVASDGVVDRPRQRLRCLDVFTRRAGREVFPHRVLVLSHLHDGLIDRPAHRVGARVAFVTGQTPPDAGDREEQECREEHQEQECESCATEGFRFRHG